MEYDHQYLAALGDCAGCHNNKAAVEGTSWAGARFHPPGSASPKTCLPCHAGERPTSTAGWVSATYTKSPFDYGTNARGVTHGAGQDCATCHTGPGTGAGSDQNWQGGVFAHGPGSVAATTCIACHSTQVPAQVVMSFDHAKNGRADCFGCHQATVTAGKYVNYFSPSTGTLPGGDWQGGRHTRERCCPRAASVSHRHRDQARARGQRPRHRHDIQPSHADERHRAHVDGDRFTPQPRYDRQPRQHQVLALPHQQQRHRDRVRGGRIPRRAHQLPGDARRRGGPGSSSRRAAAATATRRCARATSSRGPPRPCSP